MITAIIQARMQATRLPNKVLLLLGKKTVLENVIGRVKQANLVNKIVVATSTEIADDQIYNLCKKIKVDCFRGSLNDVLDRYYQAALQYNATDICRITSDCPLIDPKVIDQVIEIYLSKRYDFVSNSHPVATYPDGFDVWVFSFQALKKAWQDAKLPSEREHVTSYIWNNPNKFKIYNLKNKVDQSHYRLTIDEEKDYKLLKRIFSEVKDLTTENILRFLDNNQEI
ncbi:MAG: glycosyltransferase family protein, partial [Patescibacteria group bacterium]